MSDKFKIGGWYRTSDGFVVQFVRPIEMDGQYNVFRHTEDLDYLPYYTDENGHTAYGEKVLAPGGE